MVLVKMLMEIYPLSMRDSMVMTMVVISPSRRDVSRQNSSAGALDWFRLGVSSRKLAYDFSSDERLHIAEDGHQRATRGPTRQGALPVGVGAPPTLVAKLWAPSGTFFAQ